jgi:hypothetical protein
MRLIVNCPSGQSRLLVSSANVCLHLEDIPIVLMYVVIFQTLHSKLTWAGPACLM